MHLLSDFLANNKNKTITNVRQTANAKNEGSTQAQRKIDDDRLQARLKAN